MARRFPAPCERLRAADRTLAKRRLAEEMEKVSKIDPKLSKMPLEELLRLYEERLSQYASKTVATRRSIMKSFRQSWAYGLDISLPNVNAGQLELWLAGKSKDLKNATYNGMRRRKTAPT